MNADLLTNLDPNLIKMAAAALIFGLIMASARNFAGKLNGLVFLAAGAWIFYTHDLHYLYAVMAYGAVSSVLLLSATRRAHA